jgi:hypothetical protein
VISSAPSAARKPRDDENAADDWRAYSDGLELHVSSLFPPVSTTA